MCYECKGNFDLLMKRLLQYKQMYFYLHLMSVQEVGRPVVDNWIIHIKLV